MPTAVVARSWFRGRAWIALVATWLGGVGAAAGDDPPRRPAVPPTGVPTSGPTAIILEPPANRNALLDKLRRPDFILWDAPGLDRWLLEHDREAGPGPGPVPGSPGVVMAVTIAARPAGPRAALTIEYRISVPGDDRVQVPIALDGLILGRVSESGVDCRVATVGDRRGWAVELRGKGEHVVAVEAGLAVRSVGASQSLELAIPRAATTRVELMTTRPLAAARAGPDEPLAIDPAAPGPMAQGHLGPRGRLELTWQEQGAAGEVAPAVLAARGELAVTVGLDALETRETWSIAALRGEARRVTLRLKADEEVVTLEVDRRPVAASRRHLDGTDADELVVPLAEVLASPKSVLLILATRRPRPPGGSRDRPAFVVEGHPIEGARSQTGAIGVARSTAVEITPEPGPALRRVDPRTDLPDAFRGRPDNWLGFEFAEQPFRLGLALSPVSPRYEVTARSTVTPGADGVEVATTLIGRVWQGRLFEVRVAVPAGLHYRPTEPTADGPTVRPLVEPGGSSPATLVATFARPLGPGESFAVSLRGDSRVLSAAEAAVPLFGPIGPTVAASEVALVSGPNRRFDLPEASPPRFTRLDQAPAGPVAWAWPAGFDPNLGATVQWLRAERVAESVGVAVVACPRSIRHRSSLTVAVDREGGDVVDEVVGDVAHGATTTLDLALPPEVPESWQAEAGETLEREALDRDPSTGWRCYRLKLGEPTDAIQVRLRYRRSFVSGADGKLWLKVQPARVLDGTSTGQMIRLQSETDVTLAAQAPGWIERPVESRGGPTDSAQLPRQGFEHAGGSAPAPVEATVTLGTLAELPTLVASRAWLRSAELPGGALASTVQYRLETHPRAVTVRLPAGSRWVRGAAGAQEVGPPSVELVAADTYRITLPAAVGLGPVPLRVESILDEAPADGLWPAPELVGGVVQQSAWELSLLGTRAGVGVPAGWTDENHWYRSGLVWKREPRRTEADLARWLADGLPRPAEPAIALAERAGVEPASGSPAAAPGDGWTGDFGSGRHSYLFSRPGPPTPLRFRTFGRATLVLLCSGPVLLVGLLVLGRRPPPRWAFGALLVLGLGLAATVEVNTALLVGESAAVGGVLAGIAALIHGVLDRRGRVPAGPLPGTMVVAPSPSMASVAALESASGMPDGPTEIRNPGGPPDGSTSEFRFPGGVDPTLARLPEAPG